MASVSAIVAVVIMVSVIAVDITVTMVARVTPAVIFAVVPAGAAVVEDVVVTGLL